MPLFDATYERLLKVAPDVKGVMVITDQDASQKAEGKSQEAKRGGQEAEGGERLAVGMLSVSQHRYEIMRHADCACAVSGTVTAELALLGVPMVVCYHLPWLSRFLARVLVRTPYFALPNILAGTRLVPELLESQPEVLARTLAPLMLDSEERRRQLEGLAGVAAGLGPPGAMGRICALARELAAAGRRPGTD
jgi:lipid-A-disaccharide synthase